MTDQVPQDAEAETDTPRVRLYRLLRIATSSVLISLLAAGISTSALKLWHRAYPEPTVKVWQIPEKDYARIIGTFEASSANLATLQKLVADNPEAAKLVSTLQSDIESANSTMARSSFIEERADAGFSWSPITVANAQEANAKPESKSPDMIIFFLLGLVGFVLVLFTLLFAFSKDKTKSAFAEKMISTIIGFALGMITGSSTGKIK